MTFTDRFFDGIKSKYKSKYPEAKEGERPIGAEVMQPSKEELDSKGEEQKEVKKETFERDILNAINTLADNQKLMNDNQTLDRERLKRLDEKLTEITKMLTGA